MTEIMLVSGEGSELLMATGTGDRSVLAQSFIKEEFPPQEESFPGKRIVLKIISGLRPVGRNGEFQGRGAFAGIDPGEPDEQ